MYISDDKEMRSLGKLALLHLPSITNKWGKMLLYLNAGGTHTELGKSIFFREKKTLRNYDKLLEVLEMYGYTLEAYDALVDIERKLKSTKKLTELLKEDTRLMEFRKRVEPITVKRDMWWYK